MVDINKIFLLILLVVEAVAMLRVATDESCQCGERKFSQFGQLLGTQVIGGEEAEVNEFPWAALLSIRARGSKPVRCGGSLINDRYVVTAAHCIPLSADMDITVYLGEHNTRTSLETTTFITTAKLYRYQKHWSYHVDRKSHLIYDFALLELAEPVDWASYPHIRPVCLPGEEERDYSGEVATVVGWGNDFVYYEAKRYDFVKGVPALRTSNFLKKLDLSLLGQSKCQDIFQEAKLPIQISESNLCAVSEVGDTCGGDSGGGLVRHAQGGGYYELVGIVSYGVGCNSSSNGLKIPGVYARVSQAVNWIRHLTDDGTFCAKPTVRQPLRTKTATTTTTRATTRATTTSTTTATTTATTTSTTTPTTTTAKSTTTTATTTSTTIRSTRKYQTNSNSVLSNSGWSDWGSFSLCDRECGIGKKSRDRYCNGSSCRHTQQTQDRPCIIKQCDE